MANVNIYTEEINDVVLQRGHWADWERAAVCHCVTKDSGQPNFSCSTCGGSGYRYLPAQRIKVAVSSFNSQFNMETLELREPGTAYVTPTRDIVMGYKDRLKFPDFKCIFSEVIHWDFYEDGRGISPKTYRNIKEVVFLADDKFEYEEGVDFEITEDKHHIRWINRDCLDDIDGKNMSLLYYTTPSYLVTDLLHELRATLSDRKTDSLTFRELPKQYKVNREDFIYKVDVPEPVITEDNTIEDITGGIEDTTGGEEPEKDIDNPPQDDDTDVENSEPNEDNNDTELGYDDDDGGIVI